MSKVVEDCPVDAINILLEYVFVILVGIPFGLILLAVGFVCCVICLPFYMIMAPYLFFSYRRQRRAMSHPLSDWALGVLPESIAPATKRSCETGSRSA